MCMHEPKKKTSFKKKIVFISVHRFDEDIHHVELDYPRDMSIWRGIGYHIDAAFQYKDGKFDWTKYIHFTNIPNFLLFFFWFGFEFDLSIRSCANRSINWIIIHKNKFHKFIFFLSSSSSSSTSEKPFSRFNRKDVFF